jgi:hypothetical protein
MDLNKFKSENFWLRVGLTLSILLWLSTLGVINRGIITERQTLTDSLNYYRKLNDSLRSDTDSLYEENFQLNHWNGVEELIIDDLSNTYPKYKNLSDDIEKQRNSNKYE